MDYGSKLYSDFEQEAEAGKLPVIIPVRPNVCYYRSYRAASWSAVYSEDHDERILCILRCAIYTHREVEEGAAS